ncbi:MAG: phytanoyl-CoA dioxygenase [Anaerolineaceae bacterium]|nr:phytanoyl-CoA dioxygenase [Anaerolineaceae bacterium]
MVQADIQFDEKNTSHTYPSITDDHAAFFQENGYLIIEDALSSDEIEELRRETASICRGDRGTLRNGFTHTPDETDDEVIQRYLCVHFPHKISDIMYRYLAHPTIVDVLTRIIGPNVKCMQSMLFVKSAGKPGQAWHQDEDFIPTRDRSLTGAWMALDDATVENGTLWVIPGSHKHGVLWPQEQQMDERFDCTVESYGFPYKDEDAIPVNVKAGAIVFFNGYLLHRSLPNYAKTGYRRVLVNHYMSAQSLLPWSKYEEGMRIAIADYRDIVMIAGKDPYGYKGTEDIAGPSVRPTKEGGCMW